MDPPWDSPSWQFARQRGRRLDAVDDAFVDSAAFPVARLRHPKLQPARLGDVSSGSFAHGRWGEPLVKVQGVHEVTLLFGAPPGSGGHGVAVATGLFGRWGFQPAALPTDLSRSGRLRIGGALHEAEIAEDAGAFHARVRLPLGRPDPMDRELVVTVVAVGVGEEEIELDWARDLRPFAEARLRIEDVREREMMDRMAAVTAALPTDIDVHRAFLESCSGLPVSGLDTSDARLDPDVADAQTAALGHAAIDRQSRLRGQDIAQATGAVSGMVGHMRALAEKVAWIWEDAEFREAAIAETVAFTAAGEKVPSLAAQRAWQAYRGAAISRFVDGFPRLPEMPHRFPDPGTMTPGAGRAFFERMRETLRESAEADEDPGDRWRVAWEVWALDRRVNG